MNLQNPNDFLNSIWEHNSTKNRFIVTNFSATARVEPTFSLHLQGANKIGNGIIRRKSTLLKEFTFIGLNNGNS